MKLLLPLLLFATICNSQTMPITTGHVTVDHSSQQVTAMFRKDGKTWISFDPITANTRYFNPVEEYYECDGKFEMITDSSCTKDQYKVSFGNKWLLVDRWHKNRYGTIYTSSYADDISTHLMFKLMLACFDGKEVHCPCGATFPIIRKNF